MDPSELRLRKMEANQRAVKAMADLHARRYVAVMAVAITLAGTSLVAGLAKQGDMRVALPVAVALLTMAVLQVRELKLLVEGIRVEGAKTVQGIERLMAEEGETDGDGEGPEQG